MLEYILKNKEWLFSGVGVVVLVGLVRIVRGTFGMVVVSDSIWDALSQIRWWGVVWERGGYFLGMTAHDGADIHVSGFQLKGKNRSSYPIDIVSGALRSNISNEKIPILLDSIPPEETNGIPAKCEFWVRAVFRDPSATREGVPVEKFLRKFGDFTFEFQYDHRSYRRRFRASTVREQVERFRRSSNPERKPMVTIKRTESEF